MCVVVRQSGKSILGVLNFYSAIIRFNVTHTYEKSIDNEKRSLYLQEKLESKVL